MVKIHKVHTQHNTRGRKTYKKEAPPLIKNPNFIYMYIVCVVCVVYYVFYLLVSSFSPHQIILNSIN